MKRLSRFMLIVVIAAFLPAAPSVAQGGDAIPQPDETLPGFKANGVYEASGIENLSLYNGDPQLAVPLGPAYPTGPGSSFQLTAYYSTRFWHMYQVPCGAVEYCGAQTVGRAHVRGQSTLGVGWTLELGSVAPSQELLGDAWYLSPDGGKHEFNQPSVGSPPAFISGAEVRVQRLSPNGYVVRRTDGTSLWLTHRYTRPTPRNGVDFSDVDRNAGVNPPDPRSERWGLQRMEDSFGRTVLEVSWQADYPSADAWKVASIQLHDPDRVIQFSWIQYQDTWDVLSSISFPILAPSGGSTYPAETLTAQFSYAPSGLFERTSFDTGWESNCQELSPRFVDLPFLATISQATNTYQFEYSLEATLDDPENETSTGMLTAFRLPTGTRVEYEYAPFAAGRPCIRGISCSSLDESVSSSTPDPEQPDPDCDFWARISPFIDAAPAVVSRTETDPTTGLSATTEYARAQFSELDPDFPYKNWRDPKRTLRRVIVKRPTGNGTGVAATRHLFRVSTDGPGLEVERRHYYGPLAAGEAGAVARSIVQCYRGVSLASSDTGCAAFAADGTISSFEKAIPGDARVSRVVTWYGANPVGALSLGGEVCSDTSATTVACKVESWADWNSIAREFAQQTVTAPKQGPSAVFLAGTQLGRRTTTAWTPKSGTSYWQPKLYGSRTVEDLYSNGCPFPPCSIMTSTAFDDETGALESSTVSISQYSNRKVEFEYTGGNPTAETISGAGLTGTYRTERTFQSGLVTTSRRTQPQEMTWHQYDVTRDEALGLVTVSRDPNGLATTYSWDSQARLRRVRPPGEHATTICYTPWSSSNPTRGALALVRKGSAEGCGTTGAVPAAGSETLEAYLYDGSGRLGREIRLLPNTLPGASPATYLAARTTERNAIGLVTAVSEWEPCGSGTDVSTCFTTSTTKKTQFSNFDVFGRARSIFLPDGTEVVKGYDDWQQHTSGTHIPATDTRVGTWTFKADSTSAYEAVRKDILGRAIAIAAPVTSGRPPEPPAAQPTLGELTLYYNDIHDQVAKVTQERIAADGTPHTQIRTFTRNAFGFLTSDTQPESGLTTYALFTALGYPQTKTRGSLSDPITTSTTYDALGRVVTVSAASAYVVNTYDDSLDENGAPRGSSKGKLTTSTNSNNYPSSGAGPDFYPRGTISDSYTYTGIGGRLSQKKTTLSNGSASPVAKWTYDLHGLVETEDHPRVPGTPGFLVRTTYWAGLPRTVTAAGQTVASSVTYNPSGGLASYTSGNGVVTTIVPDDNRMPRPKRIFTSEVSPPTSNFDTGDITYDGAGNITSMKRTEADEDTFTYDAASRLLSAKYPAVSSTAQTYSYDGWSNLTRKAGTTIPVNKETNRLTDATYGPQGNLTGLGAETYRYDGLDRQVRHEAPGSRFNYLFDASNERIVKSIPPSQVVYVLRRDMARIILQAMGEPPKATCAGTFTDVPCSDPDRGWIEKLEDQGITLGCGGGRFCPNGTMTRFEMAVFIARALTLPGSVPASGTVPTGETYSCAPEGNTSLFTDVPASDGRCPHVHYLLKQGVTQGCEAPPNRRFCPMVSTSHYEMQLFASRAWAGSSYIPSGAKYTFRGAGGSIRTEYEDSAVARDYVYLGARLVGTKEGTVWKYHATDHLGSVRLTTGSSRTVLETRKYWPWGEEAGTSGPSVLAFAGMEQDIEVGEPFRPRYYVHARNLETGFGRFLSPDMLSGTVEDPLSWNRYAYARNNPLRFVDPDGKDILDVAAGAANAIYNNFSLGAVPRRDSVNDDFQKGQILGDGLTVLLGMAEEQLGLRVAAGGILGFPESGGTTSVAVVGGATVAAHGKTVAAVGALQLLSAATRDSGGGRTGRKSNEKRVEAAEQRIKDLKDAKAQAKTKDEKKAIQDKIDHERLKMRTSEEHMRRNPG